MGRGGRMSYQGDSCSRRQGIDKHGQDSCSDVSHKDKAETEVDLKQNRQHVEGQLGGREMRMSKDEESRLATGGL